MHGCLARGGPSLPRVSPAPRLTSPLTHIRAAAPRQRSDKGERHEQPESLLQVACVNWAEEHGYLVDGSANGAVYKYGARTANAMKARGCTPGRPDLLVLEHGADGSPGLAVELKIGRNQLSDAQRAWFARAEKRGWRCEVIRSIVAFQTLVREHVTGVSEGSGSGADPLVLA